jgi:hypothetical protein
MPDHCDIPSADDAIQTGKGGDIASTYSKLWDCVTDVQTTEKDKVKFLGHVAQGLKDSPLRMRVSFEHLRDPDATGFSLEFK